MAKTTTATLTELVQDLYNASATKAFTARGQFWKTIRPEHIRQIVTGAPQGGDVVKVDVWGSSTVSTAALGETDDGTSDTMAVSQVDVTLVERGRHVETSGKLRATAYGKPERQAAWRMGDSAVRTLDKLARIALDAQTGATWVGYAQGGTTNATSVSAITMGNTLCGKDMRAGWAALRRKDVPPFDDGYYRCFMHPDVFMDLKSEDAVHHSFTAVANYSNTALKPIADETGIYEGFRIILTTTAKIDADAGATVSAGVSADVYTTYFVGPDALAMARHGNVPRISLVGPTPQVGDVHGRVQTIGWYALAGFSALQDNSTYKIFSSSSMDTDAT